MFDVPSVETPEPVHAPVPVKFVNERTFPTFEYLRMNTPCAGAAGSVNPEFTIELDMLLIFDVPVLV